ncbi:transposase, partial [Waterburya agarophytonicola]|uniref:transposase n=1 Tax=Waterburya agarophytonicola TaxID=2886916 RepID=UPI001E3642C8
KVWGETSSNKLSSKRVSEARGFSDHQIATGNHKAFQKKISEWSEKKLKIFWLPTYSPQLNLIEILWGFMKYEWIESQAYTSWNNLVEYVENILKDFGTKYTINFA